VSALRRVGRAVFAALGLAVPLLLASQGCSNVIGAGDYHVSACENVTLGVPVGVTFVASANATIVNGSLIAGGKVDTLRELRAFVGSEATSVPLVAYASNDLNTCVNCVWIYEWDASDLTKPIRAFVGESGTFTVTSPAAGAAGRVGFDLSGVRFAEATYDAASGVASRVEGGGCLSIASASVSTRTCTPSAGCDGGEVCLPTKFSTSGICQPTGAAAAGATCDPVQPNTGCATGFCDSAARTCNQACDFWGGVPVCPGGTECSVFGICYSPTFDPAAVGSDCTSAASTFCGPRGALLSGACADKGGGKVTCEKICRLNGTDCPSGKTCKAAGLDPAGFCE
jgi:hypothetical protein